MEAISERYDYLFNDLADHRLDSFPFMRKPWQPITIVLIYLYSIYVYFPKFMSNRAAFNLKKTILIYNVLQILLNSWIVYGIGSTAWKANYKLMGCQELGAPSDADAMKIAYFFYGTMLLKMCDLLETVFFILRKKFNQVSTLHVYHHGGTFLVGYLACKFFPGGLFYVPVVMNCFIHVIMYTYYLLASLGPEWQQRLTLVKSKLTSLQLIQLGLILIHTGQVLRPSCKAPRVMGYIFIPALVLLIWFFIMFYRASFLSKKTEKKL